MDPSFEAFKQLIEVVRGLMGLSATFSVALIGFVAATGLGTIESLYGPLLLFAAAFVIAVGLLGVCINATARSLGTPRRPIVWVPSLLLALIFFAAVAMSVTSVIGEASARAESQTNLKLPRDSAVVLQGWLGDLEAQRFTDLTEEQERALSQLKDEVDSEIR